jgi:hypothetical protein
MKNYIGTASYHWMLRSVSLTTTFFNLWTNRPNRKSLPNVMADVKYSEWSTRVLVIRVFQICSSWFCTFIYSRNKSIFALNRSVAKKIVIQKSQKKELKYIYSIYFWRKEIGLRYRHAVSAGVCVCLSHSAPYATATSVSIHWFSISPPQTRSF